MRERVQFFDLLRCVAAVAVIAIHVLAPYRHELGGIPFDQWVTAVGINGISRWAVPVFILITGALMLSDTRPFDLPYYARRRLGKVLIPFLFWSLFYALLSGLSASGFDSSKVTEVLSNSPEHATYYHLGFFYYFIPLYFVIPMFQWLVRHQRQDILYLFTALWLFTTVLYLAGIDGPWSYELWLYSGYLPLGYLLFSKVPNQRSVVVGSVLLGGMALAATVIMVVSNSLATGEYTVGRWLSYKTINVVLAASMVFVLCRSVGERLSAQWQKWVALISRHSLGIYLLHPIFLWPMKELGWYQGHPAWVIPLWVVLSGAGALALSYLFSLSAKTRWLLP
ncbi:acyltransferase [Vibrio vulnificus]|uniref:acyltransferase n=1 Tax=Vibrio vulnificus TaxID=672 RepID=UPI0001F5C162|nr:acyltransferase [Vibrio vulnificus]ADV85141.1 inner membrane protein [Vibrio vulnificus MO6-24/O]EGR0039703.1 acyltransferase [Vibrio vulnificus]EGR0092821.1 acyltransferase [Vibrio vulnificus]EGR0097268.1 acyltransferase [Vibrio vulnificus]EGR1425455.1 acyltransferase [Vibrio vulnificus]